MLFRSPGIGPAAVRRLESAGITRLGQLAALDPKSAMARLGAEGPALATRARGEDDRPVNPERETKSVSAETTFEEDLADLPALESVLWRMCERLSARLAGKGLSAGGVVLKLKTAGFEGLTRSARLAGPTLLPETMFDAARPLLARAADGTRYRLLGLGASPLCPAAEADQGDLADPSAPRRAAKWRAIEALRERFGAGSVVAGRSLTAKKNS